MKLRAAVRNILPASLQLWLRSRRKWRTGEPELAMLGGVCVPGRTFVDVGANLGLYAHAAMLRGMRVVAVEPHPLLARNLRRLLRSKVTVIPVALSDRPGQACMYLPSYAGRELDARGSLEIAANRGLAQREIVVETTTLDALELRDVAVIKIDVEGHELSVLRGGRSLIQRYRPALLVEIEERHHPGGSAAVFALLEELDYRCYFFWRHRLQPLAEFEPAHHQPSHLVKQPDQAGSPEYGCNFLCIPAQDTMLAARLAKCGLLTASQPP
jgi:FkbM family methyltransferase